jgi:hypothetical protein
MATVATSRDGVRAGGTFPFPLPGRQPIRVRRQKRSTASGGPPVLPSGRDYSSDPSAVPNRASKLADKVVHLQPVCDSGDSRWPATKLRGVLLVGRVAMRSVSPLSHVTTRHGLRHRYCPCNR